MSDWSLNCSNESETTLSPSNIRDVWEWIWGRIAELPGLLYDGELFMSSSEVQVNTEEWLPNKEEPESHTWLVPNEIFFSNTSLKDWAASELERRKELDRQYIIAAKAKAVANAEASRRALYLKLKEEFDG